MSYALVQTDLNYKVVGAPVQLAQPAAISQLALKPFLWVHLDPQFPSAGMLLRSTRKWATSLTVTSLQGWLVRGEQKFRGFTTAADRVLGKDYFGIILFRKRREWEGSGNRQENKPVSIQNWLLGNYSVARKKNPTEFQKLHLVMIIPKGFCWVYFAKINMLTLTL